MSSKENADEDVGEEVDPKKLEEENYEDVLTLSDIVELNDNLENQAEALLGGQNDMVCTYPEGYKFRQPLYSCKTCFAETGQLAGVCYGCSFHCHDGHDLIELYTKRKFSCDCGNSNFKTKCKLYEEKGKVNTLNKYNQNFEQRYCTCHEVYPPSDPTDNEDMHQCCVCEDWFHLSHIFDEADAESIQNDLDNLAELVCKDCVAKFPFLMYYQRLALAKEADEKDSSQLSPSAADAENCKLKKYEEMRDFFTTRSIFFTHDSWRDLLCRCSKCLEMYDYEDIAFFIDPEDTMTFYEVQRKANTSAVDGEAGEGRKKSDVASYIYNEVAKKTNNRDAALNAYLEVGKMSKHIQQYFNGLAGKVITKRDVEKCFEELSAKRRRVDPAASSGSDSGSDPWTQ